MTEQFWTMVVNAVITVTTIISGVVVLWIRVQANRDEAAANAAVIKEAADRAVAAARAAQTTAEATAKENAAKLAEMSAQVEEVHKATNSMKDQLVAATEKEALARGGSEERARALEARRAADTQT